MDQLETSFGKKSSVASVPKIEQIWLAVAYMQTKEVLFDSPAIVYFPVGFRASTLYFPSRHRNILIIDLSGL